MERVRQEWGRAPKPTFSHSSRSWSTRILISSGMAKEGWVSLSWMATWGGGGVEGGCSQSGPKTMVTVLCPY